VRVGGFCCDLRVVEGKRFLGCLERVESNDGSLVGRIRRPPNVPNISHNLGVSLLGVYPFCKECFNVARCDEVRQVAKKKCLETGLRRSGEVGLIGVVWGLRLKELQFWIDNGERMKDAPMMKYICARSSTCNSAFDD